MKFPLGMNSRGFWFWVTIIPIKEEILKNNCCPSDDTMTRLKQNNGHNYLNVFNSTFTQVEVFKVDVRWEIGALDSWCLKHVPIEVQLQRVPVEDNTPLV